jgi:hypothetical protein
MPSFSNTYEAVDWQIWPAGLNGWPEQRLVLDNWVPAMLMVGSAMVYLIVVFILAPRCKPRTPERRALCGRLRSSHNLALCAFSAFACIGTAVELWSTGELFDTTALLCTPVEGRWLRPLSVLFILSKAYEGVDTVFLVWLGKRPPQFLHLYHHSTTFWLFSLIVNFPGPEKLGLLLNGGVHWFMYAHYYSPWPKPIVPLITVLQIAQLAYCIYAYHISGPHCAAAASSAGELSPMFSSGAAEHRAEFLTPYAMVPVYLIFFLHFFAKRWLCPGKKKGGDKPKTL